MTPPAKEAPGASPDASLLRIASRASPLALAQSRLVAKALQDSSGRRCEVLPITTQADQMIDKPLAEFGGKGLFVKELEQALFDGRADLAVHSLKDVPSELPEGLVLAATLARGPVGDVIVAAHALPAPDEAGELSDLSGLPEGWRVGTGSLRRRCQLRARRPDWRLADLRGNIGTRLARLQEGELDAIVLARAGLERLAGELGSSSLAKLQEEGRSAVLNTALMLPCPGQGALCIECLADSEEMIALARTLHDEECWLCTEAERELGRRFGADCHMPFAAGAIMANERLWLEGLVARADGGLVRSQDSVEAEDASPATIAGLVYEKMQRAGAPASLSPSVS